MHDYWPNDLKMREGKRIRVEALRIRAEAVRVLFLTPDQYAAYKLVRDSGGEFAFTHELTIDPPEGDRYWTPPTMGVWWVLMSCNCGGPMAAHIVDAALLN